MLEIFVLAVFGIGWTAIVIAIVVFVSRAKIAKENTEKDEAYYQNHPHELPTYASSSPWTAAVQTQTISNMIPQYSSKKNPTSKKTPSSSRQSNSLDEEEYNSGINGSGRINNNKPTTQKKKTLVRHHSLEDYKNKDEDEEDDELLTQYSHPPPDLIPQRRIAPPQVQKQQQRLPPPTTTLMKAVRIQKPIVQKN